MGGFIMMPAGYTGGVSLKIGELSKETGASIRSIRYYEQQGLMAPARLQNGYREYSRLAV
jgi:DNA-binding transcriptional MerR regulator